MNILRRELTGGFKSLLAWVVVVVGLNFLMFAIYPSFVPNVDKLNEYIKAFPPEMIRAFGLDKLSMADPIGFYASEMYILVILFGGIFAAVLGAGMLAKEEDEKTVEFLLAKPASRGKVLAGKFAAVVLYLAAFNIAVLAGNFAGFAIFITQPYSNSVLLQLSLAPFFAQLCLASVGFLLALYFTRRRAVYSVGIGMAVGTYFVGLISLMSDRYAWMRWLSPFRYVEAVEIATEGGINPVYALAMVAVSAIAVGATYVLYQRRDITV